MSSRVEQPRMAAFPAQRGDGRGGAPCLDFVNTVDAHDRSPASDDLYPGYVNLLAWCNEARVVPPDMAQRLRRRAQREPRVAAEVRKRAVALREALYRIATALADGDTPDAHDLATLEREIHAARANARLRAQDGVLAWAFTDEPELDRLLWPIAVSAEHLLRSPEARRIRRCAGEACQRLFLETTKNGSRRYCSTRGCGNRERVRRFRERATASS
ncbi:MAG TPA: ABATE domain-containing protein [Thermomicrobiales bacterium]|nr:ABATE domain-containing protein [Thermomicrobiales bacterium]